MFGLPLCSPWIQPPRECRQVPLANRKDFGKHWQRAATVMRLMALASLFCWPQTPQFRYLTWPCSFILWYKLLHNLIRRLPSFCLRESTTLRQELHILQYTVFDQLKLRLLKTNQNNTGKTAVTLSAFTAFVLGALSKSIATILTYPAIRCAAITLNFSFKYSKYRAIWYLYYWYRCKVVIQAADSDDDEAKKAQRKSRKTLSAVIRAIWKKEGILGFFKGMHAQILKTVLSSAFLLMIKEKIAATSWVLILAIRRYLFLTRGKLKGAWWWFLDGNMLQNLCR